MTKLDKFTKMRKSIFLRIKYLDHMPQWMYSPIANYHPFMSTIYILKKDRYKFKLFNNKEDKQKRRILRHELTHWFIHKFLWNSKKLHKLLDKYEHKILYRKQRSE